MERHFEWLCAVELRCAPHEPRLESNFERKLILGPCFVLDSRAALRLEGNVENPCFPLGFFLGICLGIFSRCRKPCKHSFWFPFGNRFRKPFRGTCRIPFRRTFSSTFRHPFRHPFGSSFRQKLGPHPRPLKQPYDAFEGQWFCRMSRDFWKLVPSRSPRP